MPRSLELFHTQAGAYSRVRQSSLFLNTSRGRAYVTRVTPQTGIVGTGHKVMGFVAKHGIDEKKLSINRKQQSGPTLLLRAFDENIAGVLRIHVFFQFRDLAISHDDQKVVMVIVLFSTSSARM